MMLRRTAFVLALLAAPRVAAAQGAGAADRATLSPLDTARTLDAMLRIAQPADSLQRVVHETAAWLRRIALAGYRADGTLARGDGPAPVVWPRRVTAGAWRPIRGARGTRWLSAEPAAVLERYARWSETHPATGALAPAPVPLDSIARLPGRAVEQDSGSLLAPDRLRRLSPDERAAWARYLARSRALSRGDRGSMAAELASVERSRMRRAPWTHHFEGIAQLPGGWFATDTARRMGESILSYQTPSGGWSKHVDFRAGVRLPGVSYLSETSEWRFIPTIDNWSTTEELRFLARLDTVRPDERYRAAFARGVRYLRDAQMPSGCWPQVFPLQGGYHDAATFNDDAIVHVAQLMREIASGAVGFAAPAMRGAAARSVRGAVRCMLATQVRVNGRLAIWGQQHDPLTLRPIGARSYELASLAPDESAAIGIFLLGEPHPDSSVVRAVHAAAAWFRENEIHDITYANYELGHRAGAPPLWARMVELETGRPIFANRDGRRLYDYEQLTDRRRGYRWFTAAPAEFLRRYHAWDNGRNGFNGSKR